MTDPVSDDLEWDDEVADQEVVNMVALLREGHRFSGHEFPIVQVTPLASGSEMEGQSSGGVVPNPNGRPIPSEGHTRGIVE